MVERPQGAANYGTVNSYPLQAWLDVYAIDLSGLFAETV